MNAVVELYPELWCCALCFWYLKVNSGLNAIISSSTCLQIAIVLVGWKNLNEARVVVHFWACRVCILLYMDLNVWIIFLLCSISSLLHWSLSCDHFQHTTALNPAAVAENCIKCACQCLELSWLDASVAKYSFMSLTRDMIVKLQLPAQTPGREWCSQAE